VILHLTQVDLFWEANGLLGGLLVLCQERRRR
jgi:hypothetical protein